MDPASSECALLLCYAKQVALRNKPFVYELPSVMPPFDGPNNTSLPKDGILYRMGYETLNRLPRQTVDAQFWWHHPGSAQGQAG